MKLKQTIALLTVMGVAVSAFAQGQLIFKNGTTSRVIDGKTGLAALSGVYTAGLYYTVLDDQVPDVPNPGVPNDGWSLAATTPVISNPIAGGGQYSGSTITLSDPATAAAEVVLVQVRAWEAQYASYEAAFNARGWVGHTEVLSVTLGGGALAPPSLAAIGISGMTTSPVPEPSTVVLGLLGGLGAMILLCRRQ